MDEAVPQDAVVCIAVAGGGVRRLRTQRVEARLTQAQLALRSGVSQESISRLERGIQQPQAATLQRVADALDMPAEHLLAVDAVAQVTVCVEVGELSRSSTVFRERLVAALEAGFPRDEAVQHFGVSRRTIARWLARHRAGQSLANQPPVGRPSRLSPAQVITVRQVLREHPGATLAELADRVAIATGVRYSPSHLCRIRRRLDLPRNAQA
jgi:transposase/DNA-binding XRE family transcriptional regulator